MSYHELNLEERIAIRVGLVKNLSLREIARKIGDSVNLMLLALDELKYGGIKGLVQKVKKKFTKSEY